jgi:hypothetical protein
LSVSKDVDGIGDLAYASNGAHLFAPSAEGVREYATSDLSVTHTYDFGGSPSYGLGTVDVGGTTFVGGGLQNAGHAKVFEEGAATPICDAPFVGSGTQSSGIVPRGARFSPTGDRFYAVIDYGATYALEVIADPTHPASASTITSPNKVTVGDPIQISGSLSYADASAVQAGEEIQIWQAVGSHDPELLGTTATLAGGAWSFERATTADDGNKTLSFHAVFEGNATHRASTSATTSTLVARIRPTLRLRTSKGTITVGDRVQIGVHLEMDPTINHHVSIFVTYGSGSDRIATITVDNKGNGSIRQAPIHNAEYWAVSTQDKTHDAARSNHEKVKVRAKVTTALSRYYATKSGVRLYHKGTDPLYKIKVEPNSSGLTVGVALQKKTSSGWKTIANVGFKLRRGSTITLVINSGSLARNITYRTIAYFKSNRNALGLSKWEYFRFT